MSAWSLGANAVARDVTAYGAPLSASAAADRDEMVTFPHLFVAQIPSEVLLAYTAALSVVAGIVEGTEKYLPVRWGLYGAAVILSAVAVVVSYLARRTYPTDGERWPHRFPWLGTASATMTMAIWGLVVPGSALQGAVSGTGYAIGAPALAIGGVLAMALLAPFLGRGNGVTVRGPSDNSAAQPEPQRAREEPVSGRLLP